VSGLPYVVSPFLTSHVSIDEFNKSVFVDSGAGYSFHVPLRAACSTCADYGDRVLAVLIDELVGSKGNGYNGKSDMEYL
jgi:hypothetical protein